MRKSLAYFLGVVVCLAALGGCDDRESGKPHAKSARLSAATTTRFGSGWRNVADGGVSTWRFMERPAGDAAPARPDALDAIKAALDARMLPPRDSVRIADLIGKIARAAPRGDDPGVARPPDIMITTSPWNDHTWLLWVSVDGLERTRPGVVSVDFNARSVLSFRPLGDVDSLPDPAEGGGRAQVLYELAPDPDGPQTSGTVYAVLHIGGAAASHPVDRPIGPANFVDSIDNAPDSVRFATAVAGFAELLRGDPGVRDLSCAEMIALAESADQPDPDGVRAETIDLMRRAEPLIDQPPGDPQTAEGGDQGR